MDDGGIQEEEQPPSARPLRPRRSGGSSRWVDASEVDSSESPHWSLEDEQEPWALSAADEAEVLCATGGALLSRRSSSAFRRRLGKRPKRADSLDVEAMNVRGAHGHSAQDISLMGTVAMAFQTLGVVYGDMGTSPLYVFSDVFSKVPIKSEVEILGALSLVMYTIALIPFAKYVFIVLKANDNGEGGTFALYSLICRYAKVSLLPNQQRVDENISSFRLKLPTPELERALLVKDYLEKKPLYKNILLFLVLMGTSMVIGDGILTPSMSVMSAVSGLQGQVAGFDADAVVIISILVLVLLFSVQSFGTGKVGIMFAPVLALWFLNLGSIGIYNIIKYDTSVVRALNPMYIYYFFKMNGIKAWSALGGCVLCITGAEAMFADLGHFTVKSIQLAFTAVVFPCLLIAYMGQAAYLMKHPLAVERIFYDSVPEVLFWPVFVIATLAAMIASQAMISATFSCIKQAMALGCFPRIKIIHTSKKVMGQIYIPVMNWFLMIMCIIIVATFRSTNDIANAYGIAEVGVMMVSTALVTLVMLLIWQTNLYLVLCFPIFFGAMEFIYLTAVMSKLLEGGWLPLAFSSLFLCIMYTWNYGSVLKYQSEMRGKISLDFILDLGSTLGTVRVPGIGLVYNELVQGIPSIFGHLLITLPAMHSTIVFVCIKYVPVPYVPLEERFLFRRVGQKDYHMFRCVARYGYKDVRKEDHGSFEHLLVESLERFLRREAQELALEVSTMEAERDDVSEVSEIVPSSPATAAEDLHTPLLSDQRPGDDSRMLGMEGSVPLLPSSSMSAEEDPSLEYELAALREAMASGFTYLLAHGDVRARKQSFFTKKFIINYFYAFLRRNCRGGTATLKMPHSNIMRVGMTYMV
ncbi:potassium transporter 23 [Triticum urartu]|nr:potassium transporter 23 [Triticum urartu]